VIACYDDVFLTVSRMPARAILTRPDRPSGNYCSRQTSCERGASGEEGNVLRAHQHTFQKHQLFRYLHASSYAWYQDLTSRVAVIMEGEARQGRYNRDIHSKG
jgi:hypothetical protein